MVKNKRAVRRLLVFTAAVVAALAGVLVNAQPAMASVNCYASINPTVSGNASSTRVSWDASLDCSLGDYQSRIVGRSRLVDRSACCDGTTLANGSSVLGIDRITPGSRGSVDLAPTQRGGGSAEIIFELQVTITVGDPVGLVPWNCDGGEGRILQCSTTYDQWGLPTTFAVLGSDSFATQLPRTFGTTSASCTPGIDKTVLRDDAKRESTISYSANITCANGFAPNIQMVMDLYDRTPGQNDQPLTLRKSGSGNGTVVLNDNPPLFDRNFPKGTQAEIVIEANLRTPDGTKWTQCLPLPGGLREARPCEGINTDTLKVFVGTGNFATGVKQPPEECKTDTDAAFGNIVGPDGAAFAQVSLVPNIRYCGIFDWGQNSRITSVQKLATTRIVPLSVPLPLSLCDANFFPNPPAVDPDPVMAGNSATFRTTVRFEVGVCQSNTAARFLILERTYRPDGTVLVQDRVI